MLVLVPCLGIWIYSIVDFSRTDERDMGTFSRDAWMVVLALGSVAAELHGFWAEGLSRQAPHVGRDVTRCAASTSSAGPGVLRLKFGSEVGRWIRGSVLLFWSR